jgi:NAD(P)H-dependent flavin oxidoreductase YrpB (nitropropane dioxygenase family)
MDRPITLGRQTALGEAPVARQRVAGAVYTDAVSGIHANFLADTVPANVSPDRSAEGAKRWKDIWSAGQGVGLVHEVRPIAEIVEALAREAHDTLKGLGGGTPALDGGPLSGRASPR